MEIIGILKRTTEARENTIIGKEKEAISLAWSLLMVNKYTNATDITDEMFENELNKNGDKTHIDYVDNDSNRDFSVTFNDTGHIYIVDKNGNIISQSNGEIIADDKINLTDTDVAIPIETTEYDFKAEAQEFTASKSGYYKLEVWGAQGGSYNEIHLGGYGGYATGEVYLKAGEKIYIYTGGTGSGDENHKFQAGGYNGGGDSTPDGDGNTRQASGGGYFGGNLNQNAAGGGSGYIANTLLVGDKYMVGYDVEESNETNTKTISIDTTDNVSETAQSDKAKIGNGYAKVSYVKHIKIEVNKTNKQIIIDNTQDKIEISTLKYSMNKNNQSEILESGTIVSLENNKATINYTSDVGIYYFAIKLSNNNVIIKKIVIGEEVALVPTMTSNESSLGKVTASSYYSNSYAPYMAFDDKTDSWCARGTSPCWIMYEFPEAVSIYKIKMRGRQDAANAESPKTFIIQGSNDGENFDDLGNFIANNYTSVGTYFLDGMSEKYKFIRLYVTSEFTKSNTGISYLQYYSLK